MMNAVTKRRAPITDEERQGIARAYCGGKSFTEIEMMFSVSDSSIKRILDEKNIPYPKKRRAWTDEERKKVERYHSLGWDAETIGKQIGRNKSSVKAYICNGMGAKPNGQKRTAKSWTTSEMTKCQEMYEKGMRSVDIAKELGRTEGSVSGWISDHIKDTIHSRAIKARRLDGTPMPENKKEEVPVKPSLSEQIETAKAKIADENEFAIEELHRKTITGKMACYTIENNNFDFHIITPVHTKAEFGALVDEMAKVYALM